MKNLVLIISISCLLFVHAKAQQTQEIIAQSKALVAQKKYASAFKTLSDYDPKNTRPDVVIEKVEIARRYHVNTIMHQFFSFTDIEPNEDILDYREQGGSYDLKVFSAHTILDSLMRVFPENAKLNKSAALFYFDVLINYGENWLKEPYELVQLIDYNIERAHLLDLGDYETYYALGYVKLITNRAEQSVPDFQKSLDFNDKFAPAYHNIAYALQSMNRNNDALSYARQALEYYQSDYQKADVSRMIAALYSRAGEKKTAQDYFERAYKLSPTYYNVRALLDLYLTEGNKKAQDLQLEFFMLEPSNPTIFNDLVAMYARHNQNAELIKFFEKQLKQTWEDIMVTANLNLYLSVIYKESDKAKSRKYLEAARDVFAQELEPENPIFEAINKALAEY